MPVTADKYRRRAVLTEVYGVNHIRIKVVTRDEYFIPSFADRCTGRDFCVYRKKMHALKEQTTQKGKGKNDSI